MCPAPAPASAAQRLAGRCAFVTGAASGIGAATAHRLAAEGARVLVADIDEDTGAEVAAAIRASGGSARFQHCDVADESSWAAAGRLGRPEEVAAAVAFLAGDDASFVTGASLVVDGGWSVLKNSS